MSYHNTSRGGTGSNARRSTTTPTPARQNITNTQRQAAPAGFHYMPDGTLMSDADHAQNTASTQLSNDNQQQSGPASRRLSNENPQQSGTYHLWFRLTCSMQQWTSTFRPDPNHYLQSQIHIVRNVTFQKPLVPCVNQSLVGCLGLDQLNDALVQFSMAVK